MSLSGKKRCDSCRKKSTTYKWRTLNLCESCKHTIDSCDNYSAKSVQEVKPATSKARYESQRMLAAKARQK